MSKPRLAEEQWREVFKIRCRSKRGERISIEETALLGQALKSDASRYSVMSSEVFNATVPAGSYAHLKVPVRSAKKAVTVKKKTRAQPPKRATAVEMGDVRRAKAAFDAQRTAKEACGIEACLVVVGYVSGREPFRLLSRVAADTGHDALPDPPVTPAEMQEVAYAAKIAFAKMLAKRSRAKAGRS